MLAKAFYLSPFQFHFVFENDIPFSCDTYVEKTRDSMNLIILIILIRLKSKVNEKDGFLNDSLLRLSVYLINRQQREWVYRVVSIL